MKKGICLLLIGTILGTYLPEVPVYAEETIHGYNRAIVNNPEDAMVYIDKARFCEKTGRTSEAIESYQDAITHASSHEKSLINFARDRIRELEKKDTASQNNNPKTKKGFFEQEGSGYIIAAIVLIVLAVILMSNNKPKKKVKEEKSSNLDEYEVLEI